MYSELFTSGCSFLTGAFDNDVNEYLSRPHFREQHRSNFDKASDRSFPQLLAKNLNIPLINRAEHGQNNSYIIRTAYNYIKNRRENSKPSIMVLGLTDFARREVHYPYVDDYHPISPSDYHFHSKKYHQHFANYITPQEFTILQDNIYKYTWNENLILSELIQDLNMLHSFAKYSNCKLIVFQSFHNSKLSNLAKIFSPTEEKYKNEFDFFNFGFRMDKIYTWSDFIKLYAPEHKGSHPLSYDTQLFANYMAEYIMNGKVEQLNTDIEKYTKGFKKNFI